MAPQLHNLVPHEEKDQYCWNINISTNTSRKNKRSHIGASEDKKLELRLGLPGDIIDHHEDKKALVVQADTSLIIKPTPPKEDITRINWLPNTPFVGSSSSLAFKKKYCPDLLHESNDHTTDEFANSSPPNCCDKRTARAPVGWPPVRSFRKNLGSNSFSKSDNNVKKLLSPKDQGKTENGLINNNKSDNEDHMFVKINMEGVPIGRKVDLKAYDSYEKLSYAIDQLFRGLLAAQTEYSENPEEIRDTKTVSNGEYTLVYEDNEGDRMLVGDVPWKMFVSTAKRLRVLRTLELSTLNKVSSSTTRMEKTPLLDSTGINGK